MKCSHCGGSVSKSFCHRSCSCYIVGGKPCSRCSLGYDEVDTALDLLPAEAADVVYRLTTPALSALRNLSEGK